MQQDFSQLYWGKVMPALERLFDELAPPHELLRIEKLEIDLGLISSQTLLSATFIDQLLEQLTAAIAAALEKNTNQAIRSPLRLGLFELWLYFLENGSLPGNALLPDSTSEWHRQVLDTLGLEADAIERLHQLLQKQTTAFERLILQYDQNFLLQITRLFTGHRHDDLPNFIQHWAKRTVTLLYPPLQLGSQTDTLGTLEIPGHAREEIIIQQIQTNIPALRRDAAWPQRFRNWLRQHDATFRDKTPAQLQRQLENELWHRALQEVILLRKKSGTVELLTQLILHPGLAHWQPLFKVELSSGKWKEAGITPQVIQAIKRSLAAASFAIKSSVKHPQPGTDKNQAGQEIKPNTALEKSSLPASPTMAFLDQPSLASNLGGEAEKQDFTLPDTNSRKSFLPQASKETAFFVKNAGVVLLHAFLPRFFQRLELCEDGFFKTSWHQQKALYLLHYLATKTLQVPEYELVLPKFVCGIPLNQPLDHSILLSEAEQMECENLLATVIEHWNALGSVSPDSLREGFLQRDGLLEKRPAGWFLQVESNTIDLLLNRLPWNLSLMKLPWMEEILRIDWH